MNDVKLLYTSVAHEVECAPHRRRQKGFTIVEVMIAAAVMALVITTSITTLQRGFLSLDTARNITLAGQIMQCEVEKMRMLDWAEINAYPTTSTAITIDVSFTSNPAVGSRFSLSRDVAVISTGTPKGMRQITYTVSWNGYDGRTLSRSYTTYYGEEGLYDYYYNSI
jgi:prepilin-type N-terminal cleavage/methylation domain-containing protein